MNIQLNEYHKKNIAEKIKIMTYWRKHPLSSKIYINQFKLLREQRLAKEKSDIEKAMAVMNTMMIKDGEPIPADEKGIDALIEQEV